MTDTPSWPPNLEGACYTREAGWTRRVPGPDGSVRVEPVPLGELQAAGLDEHPELPDGITTLILRSQPFQNLIPRRQP